MIRGADSAVGAGSDLPLEGWQATAYARLRRLLEKAAGLQLTAHGSFSEGQLDPWSDLDLDLISDEPDAALDIVENAVATHLGTIWATQKSGGENKATLRLVLRDGRRIDVTATRSGHRSSAVDTPGLAEALNDLWSQYRFDAVLAVTKFARDDVLIGGHLTLQVQRHLLVAAMLLRDRERGTRHHRSGGSRWDSWITRLADLPAPFTRSAGLAVLAATTSAMVDLLTEVNVPVQPDSAPLLTLINAAGRPHPDQRDS